MKNNATYTKLPKIILKKFLFIILLGAIISFLFLILWVRNLFINGFDAVLLIPILVGCAIILKGYFDSIRVASKGFMAVTGVCSGYCLQKLSVTRRNRPKAFIIKPDAVKTVLVDGGTLTEVEQADIPAAIEVPVTGSFVPSEGDRVRVYIDLGASSYEDRSNITKYGWIFGYEYEK